MLRELFVVVVSAMPRECPQEKQFLAGRWARIGKKQQMIC
jgi:hypothetical protein